jgi:hypothetical protein
MSDIINWKQGDIAYHPIYGKVTVFEVSKTFNYADVMTDEKIDIGDGSMRDCFIVSINELYQEPSCGKDFHTAMKKFFSE